MCIRDSCGHHPDTGQRLLLILIFQTLPAACLLHNSPHRQPQCHHQKHHKKPGEDDDGGHLGKDSHKAYCDGSGNGAAGVQGHACLPQPLEPVSYTHLGLGRLRAIHLNDSKNPLGSHKDRHEQIGQGSIGLEAFGWIINHPALRHLPFYLETPQEDIWAYGREITLLRSLFQEET